MTDTQAKDLFRWITSVYPPTSQGDGGWIGVDFDGTLARHESGAPITHLGSPVPAMLETVVSLLAAGYNVRVLTARVGEQQAGDAAFTENQRTLIEDWCRTYLGQALPITAAKDFRMILLLDDRAVRIEYNTGIPSQVIVNDGRAAPSRLDAMTREEAEATIARLEREIGMLCHIKPQHSALLNITRDALTAARTAGAAEERARECVWRVGEHWVVLGCHPSEAYKRDANHAPGAPFCDNCGAVQREVPMTSAEEALCGEHVEEPFTGVERRIIQLSAYCAGSESGYSEGVYALCDDQTFWVYDRFPSYADPGPTGQWRQLPSIPQS